MKARLGGTAGAQSALVLQVCGTMIMLYNNVIGPRFREHVTQHIYYLRFSAIGVRLERAPDRSCATQPDATCLATWPGNPVHV